jgi:glutamate-ammonia-ligase adenylyltransferase
MTEKAEHPYITLISWGEDREILADTFTKLGFREPGKAATLWEKMFPGTAAYPGWKRHIKSLCKELAACPDPDMALLNLSRLIENFSSSSHFFSSPFLEAPVCQMITTIFSCSFYLSDILINNPEYLSWLIEEQTLTSTKSFSVYRKELEDKVGLFGDCRRALNSIKRYKRQQTLRIGARDLMGLADVEDVTAEISFLADAIIETISSIAFLQEAEKLGLNIRSWEKESSAPYHNFAVISLGKLGGSELNYSSDIDLMFVSNPEAEKEEATFYTGLARRITNYLSNTTEEGKLYRVDLRLRPDGESGPLVVTTLGHLDYMNRRGRPWERQALLKVRATAGNRVTGKIFEDNCEKIAFSEIVGLDPLQEMLTMRRQSVARLSPGEQRGNIKLMSGGIRDIEFIVQAYQLTHGLKHPELRSRNTLESLARLYHFKLLSERVYSKLSHNYRLFRTIEHRLQLFSDTLAHTLPSGRDELRTLGARVARSAVRGVDQDNFQSALSAALQSTKKLFSSSIKERDPGEVPVILYLPPGEKSVEKLLRKFNISGGDRVHRFLHSLVYGDFPKLEPPDTLRAAVNSLPVILHSTANTPDPALTIKNLVNIIKSTGAVRSTLELIAAEDDFLRLLLHISAYSTNFSDILSSHPEFLDPLLEGIKPLEPEISGGTMTMRLSSLSQWYRESLLHIFCQVPFYRNGPDSLGPALANITEETVKRIFLLSGCHRGNIALFALGSLGRKDFGFGSDLDLVAVTAGSDDDAAATRQLRDFIDYSQKVGIGHVDMRLRGEGKGSPLVRSVDYYKNYFESRAGLWELLTFTNCRFICGHKATRDRFAKVVAGRLNMESADNLSSAAAKGRKKMEPGNDFSAALAEEREKLESLSESKYNIKHACGGGYDIDFIMSAAELISPALRPPGNSREEIDRILVDQGLLSQKQLDTLIRATRLFHLIKNSFALHGLKYPPLPEREEYAEEYMSRFLSEIQGKDISFFQLISETKTAVRDVFSAFLGQLE